MFYFFGLNNKVYVKHFIWLVSNSEMRNFCPDQGRTRVFGPRKAGQEGVRLYAAAGDPRRTPSRAKRAIYGWILVKSVAGSMPYFFIRFQIVTRLTPKIRAASD